MYRSYEEYMQTVLGYNVTPNTYVRDNGEYYDIAQVNSNIQELSRFYPEIYGVVYPVVQKVCSRRNVTNVTEDMINQMVEEVYNVIEPGDDIIEPREEPLKNGDVRNPRAKETSRQRRVNPLMRDLIRILLLRELGGRTGWFPGRPGGFPGEPGMPPPPRPGMGFPGGLGRPPLPPRPGMDGPGPVRPR